MSGSRSSSRTSIRTLLTLGLALAGMNVALLLVLNLGISLTTVVLTPAEASMIPRIVPEAPARDGDGRLQHHAAGVVRGGLRVPRPAPGGHRRTLVRAGGRHGLLRGGDLHDVRPSVGAAGRQGLRPDAQPDPRTAAPAPRGIRGDRRQPRGRAAAGAPGRRGLARRRPGRPGPGPGRIAGPRPAEPHRGRPAAGHRRRRRRARAPAVRGRASRGDAPARPGSPSSVRWRCSSRSRPG